MPGVAIKLKKDKEITIAVGKSRFEKKWQTKTLNWGQFLTKLQKPRKTPETYSAFMKLSKAKQDALKDVGGFVGGAVKDGRRSAGNIAWRSLITLDADYASADFWDLAQLAIGYCACAVYTTRKHSPENPRYRLLIPLARFVTPDEYQAVARSVAYDIGIEQFDDTTYEPGRLMYWPSISSDGVYFFDYNDGDCLEPDDYLNRYPDWTDQSLWPESSRAVKARQKLAEKAEDPLSKKGLIGAFCRTYGIAEAIEKFLPGVYTACAVEGRYTYTEGSSSAGAVVYDDKFLYSHHATDPIGGLLVNAFDLVRLHKFGGLDDPARNTPVNKLPSYLAMEELIRSDEATKITIGLEKQKEAEEEFNILEDEDKDSEKWRGRMDINSKGNYLTTANNVILILCHDKKLADKIALDDFAHRAAIKGDLPWRKYTRGGYLDDKDIDCLNNYLEKVYGLKGPQTVKSALSEVLLKNAYHPVRDYLNGLSWDGISRVETLLIDYLGAEDCAYTRAVTRKMLIAAVARVMKPGIKFDTMLVMTGRQGQGKSLLVSRLGKDWSSDSLNTVQGKEAYEQLQGSWLIEVGELSATRRADVNAVKHFLSKQVDRFRAAYGRTVEDYPRQCVFFGSTNTDFFLRDATGNRRFWPVETDDTRRAKNVFNDLIETEVDQIWAEAVELYKAGESLVLPPELEQVALQKQESHMEESEKFGMVQSYLDTLLPDDWDLRDLNGRRAFFIDDGFPDESVGVRQRTKVCTLEIWAELFGGNPKDLNMMISRELRDIMNRMPGWKASKGGLRFGCIYGTQRGYIRE